MGGYYESAQVCEKGHLIEAAVESWPTRRQAFCTQCGGRTVETCPGCTQRILGRYRSETGTLKDGFLLPKYCHACGKPYPWTREALEAAHILMEELEGLNRMEREALGKSLEDLLADTPKADVAVVHVKKALAKLSGFAATAFKDVLQKIVTDAVKGKLGF